MLRLGILGSTRGTNMLALISAIQHKQLSAEIVIVISNKQDAIILQRAQQHQLPAKFIDPKNISRIDYDKKISKMLAAYQVDLIVLVGYMRILSAKFIAEWRNRVINVHPSLLPAFAGGIDQDVHQAVLKSGLKETGCTIHWVTEEVDAGPVIVQKKCPVFLNDTVETLKKRVQGLEGEALVEAVGSLG
jgi:phosphoribosylglycinamide formyltransferase-1